MKSARRGRLVAITLFLLIVVAVVGGMGWATSSTLELTKRNLSEDLRDTYRNNISVALDRLNTHIASVLGMEACRPFTDYYPYHTVDAVQIWSGKWSINEGDRAVVPSPLAENDPGRRDWIEFYFQATDDGKWSSPLIHQETPNDHQWCRTLDWLSSILPIATLRERVALAAQRGDHAVLGLTPQNHKTIRLSRHVTVESEQPSKRHLMGKRAERLTSITSAYRSRPADQCLRPGVGGDEVADIVGSAPGDADADGDAASVGIVPDTGMATFWLDPPPSGRPKLACVRTGYVDDHTVYQGFVADWHRLKRELLARIEGQFDEADLVPYDDTAAHDENESYLKMYMVPAMLRVPALASVTVSDAWQSVGGVLLISWGAAAAVLLVAGIGFKNLVALTERRMQLAYAVTHELRTPLTTFRLYADMLSAGLVPEDKRKEYLETLNSESIRLSSLVEGVLEYARLENHKVQLNPVEVSGDALLESIGEAIEKPCVDNGVNIRTENRVDSGVPLRTDVDVIKQITGVLVNNACRHTRGTNPPVIALRLSDEDDQVNLDVTDSGPGIDRVDARNIFKPFRRGHRADSQALGGIGLGLALARGWANLLGGRLDLVTRKDAELGGAHFRLTIPRRTPS